MNPILFNLGPFHLYSYGFCIALGILVALFLMLRRVRAEKWLGEDQVFDLTFAVLVWGFIGGRLFYVVENFSYYLQSPLKVFAVWEGGLIFYGGMIFSVLGFWLTTRNQRLPFWKTLDFIIPYGVLTHAFGRIGCFMNGCCYGKVCGFSWCVRFPALAHSVHPTQLYEAGFNFLLACFLLAKRKKVAFDGQIALFYFLLYGLGRYLLEFFREASLPWCGLTSNQWVSVGVIGTAFVLWMAKRKNSSSY